jgi:hypothetical protein
MKLAFNSRLRMAACVGAVLAVLSIAGCGSSGSSTSSSPSTTAQTSDSQSTPTSTKQGTPTQAAPAKKTVSSSLEPCDVLTMKDAEQLYPMLSSSELRAGESNHDHPQIVCLFGSEPSVSFDFIGGSTAPKGGLSADVAWEREATAFQKVAGLEVKSGETEAKVQEVSGLGERAMTWYFPLPAAGGAGFRIIWEQDGVAAKLEALGPVNQLPSEQQFLEVAEELVTRF